MLERMNRSHKSENDWGLDLLHINPKTILDIGCGGGATIQNLLKRYPEAQIVGVDFSEVAVELSTKLNKDAINKGQVKILKATLENLPFKNDSFDLVLSINTYFFWDDFITGLEAIKKVLKNNGTMLLLGDSYKGVDLTEDVQEINRNYQLKLKSPEEFKSALKKLGFKDIIIKTKEKEQWIAAIAKK